MRPSAAPRTLTAFKIACAHSRRELHVLYRPHPRAFSAPRCSNENPLQACCILLSALGFDTLFDSGGSGQLRTAAAETSITVPGTAGFTPFEVFPSPAAGTDHSAPWPSCRCHVPFRLPSEEGRPARNMPRLQGFAPLTSPCCSATLLSPLNRYSHGFVVPFKAFHTSSPCRPLLRTARPETFGGSTKSLSPRKRPDAFLSPAKPAPG